ncbi:UNVERIFIED_CONTAM: hypothetical protein GTU68_041481 [Idotea baltica]|nr:hypothetical protein [Idotea baltica]
MILESFKTIFSRSLIKQDMRLGSVILTKIIKVDSYYVWLDSRLKSEAKIARYFFGKKKKDELFGQYVSTVLEKIDSISGQTLLSIEKAQKKDILVALETAYLGSSIVYGVIIINIKGGYSVDLGGSIKGFLPGSLIDLKHKKNGVLVPNTLVRFKIIKFDAKKKNVVLSRTAVLEEELLLSRAFILRSFKKGNALQGLVKNITNFGVFVSLGGIDGLLHITDISWGRLKHPHEVFKLGDRISVKIIGYDSVTQRVSLGKKQLCKNPWLSVKDQFKIGDKVCGVVASLVDYGCFIKVSKGIEGLVHLSEISWVNKNLNSKRLFVVGQKIQVMVLEIDSARYRISLGIKQCLINPWRSLLLKSIKGTKLTTIAKKKTNFGLFVLLNNGIIGLIHISDLSWLHSLNKMSLISFQSTINAIVLSIDIFKKRISLGIKQREYDYFLVFIKNIQNNKLKLRGTIISMDSNICKISFLYNVIGINKHFNNSGKYQLGSKVTCSLDRIHLPYRFLLVKIL